MVQLPPDFTRYTRQLMGDERFERYLQSFEEDAPVSIRLNPRSNGAWKVNEGKPVSWCRNAYYLEHRPNFTFDPLFHAGCYYVQEAASMFLDTVLQQHLPGRPVAALDLCAAPGGKSTLLRTALPPGSKLYANEPIRQRASILAENISKWGWSDCIVTNNYPRDYRKNKMKFDIILCDVPCSGEGMFRKDRATIAEWSPQHVAQCQQLQRTIVADAWECLNEGGLLIYSTCTFNTKENEENLRWILSEYDAEPIHVETEAGWNITGSLLEGFNAPVYRFIPGITRSEGLFICALKKKGDPLSPALSSKKRQKQPDLNILPLVTLSRENGTDNESPEHSCLLNYQQAIAYLRHEAVTLPPDAPRGIVCVSFEGEPLGLVKNIGTRANNLYPKEWKIRTTYIPQDYEAILTHA